jgi:cytochrome P450
VRSFTVQASVPGGSEVHGDERGPGTHPSAQLLEGLTNVETPPGQELRSWRYPLTVEGSRSAVSSEARSYPFSQPDQLRLDPSYAHLREHEPLSRIQLPYGEPAWLVTRYADVKTVLGDPRFSRAEGSDRDEPRVTPGPCGGGILGMDPPEHTRLRRLVASTFTSRRVELLRPRAQEITDDLLDRMVKSGPPAELVEALAMPLPITVVCELLGVPESDRVDVQRWSAAVLSTTALPMEQVREYNGNLYRLIAGLIGQRRSDPTDDLVGALVQARDDQGRLSEDELIELIMGVLVAGHETVSSQLPNFVYVLLTHPGDWRRLQEEPDLLPNALEELMRWVPLGAVAAFPRYATEDVELEGGLVRAGEPVMVSIAAANRDEHVFADPERIDIERSPVPHVAFGYGAHHCIGAQLARMELQVAVGTLLSRFPELRLAVPEDALEWKEGMLARGPKALPVDW